MIGSHLDKVPGGVEFYQIDRSGSGRLNEQMKGIGIMHHCAANMIPAASSGKREKR